jgi:hypothetical protein
MLKRLPSGTGEEVELFKGTAELGLGHFPTAPCLFLS